MTERKCFSMYRGERCCIMIQDGVPHYHANWSYGWKDKESDAPWMEAGRAVCWAYEELSHATTIGAQGQALVDLADAVNDLSSFITEFNVDLGLASIHQGDQ